MVTKLKTHSKNEIGRLISIALFGTLLISNRELIIGFEFQNFKSILLYLSILLAFYFSASQYWNDYKAREEKKYKIKLEHRFLDLANEQQAILNKTIPNELTVNSSNDKKSVAQQKLEMCQEDIAWLQELEKAVSNSISDFDFTLERLSTIMFLSPRQIRRRLKQLTGKKYSEYLREIRMKRARQILVNREVRLIKQVAYEIGMRDVKYFSQQFKAYFGQLPSAYL